MERLLGAIHARKLDRLAAGYAVIAWLLVQAASIALPAFDVPGWVLKALILVAILGFPLTLTLGWMGARHLAGIPVEPPKHPYAHLAGLGVLAIILVLIAGEIVYRLSQQDIGSPAAPSVRPAAVSTAPGPTSIAVLPFANMTGDSKQEYFADGMSEEVLSDLASIPELRVVARASSFAFKDKNEDIKAIARLLAVRSLLEGSVREAGQHLRIRAELIDARNGYDLWSSSFDRNMTDALAVQDEIARAIVSALTHKLLPMRGKSNRPTMDPVAYRDYLQAQYELAPRTRAGTDRARVLFEKAVARQPKFPEAYAGLGRAYIVLAIFRPERSDYIPAAERAIDRALALDSENLDALGLHLDLAMRRMEWDTARKDARHMLAINPHSYAVLHELFRYYQFMGFPEAALAAAQGAAQLNRLSIVDRLNVVPAYLHLARWNEAAAAGEEARKLYPNQPDNLARLCMAYAHSNHLDKARALEAQLTALKETSAASMCGFHIAVGAGEKAKAVAILSGFAAQFPHGDLGAFDIGDNYAIAGDYADAIAWLERSYDRHEFLLFTVPYDKAIAPAFFTTPGWKALWHRPLARAWQAAHDAVGRDLAAKPAD